MPSLKTMIKLILHMVSHNLALIKIKSTATSKLPYKLRCWLRGPLDQLSLSWWLIGLLLAQLAREYLTSSVYKPLITLLYSWSLMLQGQGCLIRLDSSRGPCPIVNLIKVAQLDVVVLLVVSAIGLLVWALTAVPNLHHSRVQCWASEGHTTLSWYARLSVWQSIIRTNSWAQVGDVILD